MCAASSAARRSSPCHTRHGSESASIPASPSVLKKPRPMAGAFSVAGEVGIEPTIAVLETAVIPFNYSPRLAGPLRCRRGSLNDLSPLLSRKGRSPSRRKRRDCGFRKAGASRLAVLRIRYRKDRSLSILKPKRAAETEARFSNSGMAYLVSL